MKQMPDSMKPLLIITMLGLCETLSSLSAEVEQGPARGFYFSANAGASWVQDLSFSGDPLGTGKLKFDPGVRLDLGGGYRFSDSLAAGIETGLVANGARTVGSDEEFNSLTLFQVPILATLKYQIPLRSRFRPYLGAGAGGVYTELDNLDVLGTVNNASDFTFGYEVSRESFIRSVPASISASNTSSWAPPIIASNTSAAPEPIQLPSRSRYGFDEHTSLPA